MQRAQQKRWMVFWAVFGLAVLTLAAVHAGTITLVAKVTYSLYDSSGSTPLADNSVVYIIGSKDNVINDMVSFGTSYIANSTTGDDVFIGETYIGENTSSDGTFQAIFTFEDDDVDYLYLRFFDEQNSPIEGYFAWGTSTVFVATNHPFDLIFLDFVGGYDTDTTNHFVVIPEPGSGHLMLLLAGLLWGMRVSVQGARNKTAKKV